MKSLLYALGLVLLACNAMGVPLAIECPEPRTFTCIERDVAWCAALGELTALPPGTGTECAPDASVPPIEASDDAGVDADCPTVTRHSAWRVPHEPCTRLLAGAGGEFSVRCATTDGRSEAHITESGPEQCNRVTQLGECRTKPNARRDPDGPRFFFVVTARKRGWRASRVKPLATPYSDFAIALRTLQ